MIRRLVIFLVVMALLPAGLAAAMPSGVAAQPMAVAPLPALQNGGTADEWTVVENGSQTVAASRKHCERAAIPTSRCAPDLALPVQTNARAQAKGPADFEARSSALVGLTPDCLLGPPRSG